ncbi:hypothetical protein [Chryseobacterium indoltheticum]|uniref:hypothetical protein n=1 Tax=Chryseobacterium indoltheticum TaxID=254 RepID=UPI003F497D5A
MIKIPIINIQSVESDYLIKIKDYFNFNIDNKDKLEKVFKRRRNLEFKMLKYFHENLEAIILAKPTEIRKIHADFISNLSININNKQHKDQLFKFKKEWKNITILFFKLK